MTINTIDHPVLSAFRFFSPNATWDTVHTACITAVNGADLIVCGMPDYSERERRAIADAVLWFIRDASPSDVTSTFRTREIEFDVSHMLVGQKIEYHEFAERFSEEMMRIPNRIQVLETHPDELWSRLQASLAMLLFRYRFCALNEQVFFPISNVLEFTSVVERSPHSADKLLRQNILSLTLEALRSLE